MSHGIFTRGANPFTIGSILQIQNNGSSSTMIISTDNHYQNTGLIIGLTLGLSGLCVILFISVLIFIMIVTKKKANSESQLAYCTTPKHSSDTELSNVLSTLFNHPNGKTSATVRENINRVHFIFFVDLWFYFLWICGFIFCGFVVC